MHNRSGRNNINRQSIWRKSFKTMFYVMCATLLSYSFSTFFEKYIDAGLRSATHSDISKLKEAISDLVKGLNLADSKRERLQRSVEKISQQIPSIASTAQKLKAQISVSARDYKKSEVDFRGYDAEKTDFALESAGGRIINTGSTQDYVIKDSVLAWVVALLSTVCGVSEGARAMLQPGVLPGECWAFRGSKGEATVQLLGPVIISAVSLEHIPPIISPTQEISSAPRKFSVEGVNCLDDKNGYIFGSFEYDKNGSPIQYFEVDHTESAFQLIRIKFQSNWGNAKYTCVYRLRVHGTLGMQIGDARNIQGTN